MTLASRAQRAVVALVLAGCGATPAPPAVSAPVPGAAPPPVVAVAVTPPLVDPPASAGAAPLEGSLAAGASRPATQTLRFDVDALPVASWGEAWREGGFSLRRRADGWLLWVRTTIFAEVIVTAAGPSSEKGTPPVGFTAFTGGSFGEGSVPACGPGNAGQRLAVWDGFAPAHWTDEGMDVEMEEGDFDLATCAGTPVRSLRGRAGAIVPGYVYALRQRDVDDHGDDRESLVVFLPRGALVATAANPRTSLSSSNTGPFTRLTLSLAPGTAGAASLRLSPESLALWARLRRAAASAPFADGSALADDLLLGVDVVWQGETRLGTLSFAVPKAKGSKAYAGLLAAAKPRAM